MKKCNLTKDEFVKNIEDIRTVRVLEEQLFKVSKIYGKYGKEEFTLNYPTLQDNVIKLLAKLMNDKHDVIFRWIIDLDFGKEEKPLLVNGSEIFISTTEELYDFLIS